MKTDRSLLKTAARDSMAAAQPSVKLVTLVYILLTTVLTAVVEQFISAPFDQLQELITSGYDPQWAMYTAFSQVSLPLIMFVSILLALYSGVMAYGYTA